MWLACSSWGYPRGKPDRDPSQPRQLEAESRPKMIVKDDRFNFASDALRSAFAVVLKFRSAESEHVIRSDRSSWSCYAWRFDIISSKTFVSSAKATIRLDWTASGREFTYRTNNMEPKDPTRCGIRDVSGKGLTPWDRLCSYDSSHANRSPPKNHTDVASLGVLRGFRCQTLLTGPDRLYIFILVYPAFRRSPWAPPLPQLGLRLQQAVLHLTVQLRSHGDMRW